MERDHGKPTKGTKSEYVSWQKIEDSVVSISSLQLELRTKLKRHTELKSQAEENLQARNKLQILKDRIQVCNNNRENIQRAILKKKEVVLLNQNKVTHLQKKSDMSSSLTLACELLLKSISGLNEANRILSGAVMGNQIKSEVKTLEKERKRLIFEAISLFPVGLTGDPEKKAPFPLERKCGSVGEMSGPRVESISNSGIRSTHSSEDLRSSNLMNESSSSSGMWTFPSWKNWKLSLEMSSVDTPGMLSPENVLLAMGLHLPCTSKEKVPSLQEIATAIGYIVHMLSLVSMYLDVPLKYPLVPAMSKSAVIDPMVSEINPRDVTKLTQNRKMASSQALILDCQDLGALTKAISLLNEDLKQILQKLEIEVPEMATFWSNYKKLIDFINEEKWK